MMKMKSTLLLIVFTAIFAPALFGQINFPNGSFFSYLKGKEATSLPVNWMQPAFNTTSWAKSPAPFWYGDGTGGTQITDMQNAYSTLYLRGTFTASNVDLLKKISASINFDDGFVLWINGTEALAINAPDQRNFNSFAPSNHESGSWETFLINTADFPLFEGENTLAVQLFNVSLNSSDAHFNLALQSTPELPETTDSTQLTFSHKSGFYEDNFNLTISHPNTAYSIIYTIDGSNPQESPTAFKATNSTTVLVNPLSTNGRSQTPGFVVRAAIQKNGYKPGKPTSRTFIFLDKVKTQTSPGGSWPSSNINGQVIDNDMDPDVVNRPAYVGLMDRSLTDIPTISLITDVKNLFDPITGIYVNALNHGQGWERECSLEMFEMGKEPAFMVNAGVRIRGGWSRHDSFRKHAFRLFFREEYGDSKLHYPMFGDEGVDQFDKMDLRCAQNYAWQNSDGKHNTFIREVFMRDTQRDAGQPYTRSRYYHLYLNGMYWGLYQTQERAEARFAADYFGGNNDDYDVIKVNGTDYVQEVEATDGNMDGWMKIWNATLRGFANNQNYFELIGKKENGEIDPQGEQLVDVDNLIDYMINIFYSGNFDAPVSAFRQNYTPNNFYAINDRTDNTQGFRFFVHDAEHTLAYEAVGPTIGLYENRVNIADIRNNPMIVTESRYFHPQWLHYKLSSNTEYRQRFADRAFQQLTGNGIYSLPNLRNRLNDRVEQIEYAVIAESARYGDALKEPPYTKVDWLNEIIVLRDLYFPQRTDIVINQLKAENLFSGIEPPKVIYQGYEVLDLSLKIVEQNFSVNLQNSSVGTVYYTTNNEDPRNIGGAVNPSAKSTQTSTELSLSSSVLLKARVYDNGTWSALKEVAFIQQNQDYSHFQVTEIHYHPANDISDEDTTSGKKYEFIEFKNTSNTQSIALGGLSIDSAIRYTFPENYILPPQHFFVVASKPNSFFEKYGLYASGNFSGNLSNGGERVVVRNTEGNVIMDFTYDDKDPWPEDSDGKGPSLVSVQVNPTDDPNDYLYWISSYYDDGSPFKDDTMSMLLSPIEPIAEQQKMLIYPNPTNDKIHINLEETLGKTQISLMELNGKILYKNTAAQTTIVSLRNLHLPPGIYLLSLKNDQTHLVKKIIYTN